MSVSFYQSRNQFLKICLILNSVILPAALCGEPHWSVEVQADARIGADARTTEVWSLTDDIIAICEPQRVRTFQRSSGEIINDFTIQEDYRLISHFAGSPILRGKISAYDSDAKKWKEVKRVAGYHFTDLLTGNTFDYLAPEGWQIDLDPWKFVPGPQSPYFYIALSRHRKPSKEEQENGLQMVAHSKALILNLGTGNTAREIKSNSYSISPDRHLKQHWTPIIYPLQGDLAYSEGLVCGGGPDWSCESESDWFSGLECEGDAVVGLERLHKAVHRVLEPWPQHGAVTLDRCGQRVALQGRHDRALRQVVEVVGNVKVELLQQTGGDRLQAAPTLGKGSRRECEVEAHGLRRRGTGNERRAAWRPRRRRWRRR